ncbi:MAG TPA: metalloregulator ArsR/SmtB family transcription factor [Candidatus Limnocylindria bacterium]|jgi:ArsR family transcriptional regulator|nr:metalloregulator ArsR/SmtB family transcription factor [Candidatus Limnocylindria bacterium]
MKYISVDDDTYPAMTPLVLVSKALSDPNRVRILAILREGELCVCELCDALKLTQSTLSTHLQVIRKAELVTTRKLGKWNYYAIAPQAKGLLDSLFGFFAPSLANDRKLATDARRLKSRLALREEGACCVGFECGTPASKTITP